MENKKEKLKNILIASLILIIILLVALIVVLLNNPINNAKEIKTNEIVKLTEIEATKVLKEKFEMAETFMNEPNTYCGTNITASNKRHESGNLYYISNDFNSFDELNNFLLLYMTKDVLKQKKWFDKEKYYIEEDNNLYCLHLGKGGTDTLNKEKTTYEIEKIVSNEIIAVVNAFYDNANGGSGTDKIKITLSKNDEIWQISSYVKEQ